MSKKSRRLIRKGLAQPKPAPEPVVPATGSAVEADVMPEHMTVKHTMKVRKWMPKALWV